MKDLQIVDYKFLHSVLQAGYMLLTHLIPPGEVHNMMRYGYVAPIWMRFWAQNSWDKGPFFVRFSFDMSELGWTWQGILTIGGSLPKASINGVCSQAFVNRTLEDGTVVKFGRQTPVHSEVTYSKAWIHIWKWSKHRLYLPWIITFNLI